MKTLLIALIILFFSKNLNGQPVRHIFSDSLNNLDFAPITKDNCKKKM